MSETVQRKDVIDWDEKDGKLPGMLNVLTILSYIGCAMGLFGVAYSLFTAKNSVAKMQETMDKMESAPEFAKKMLGPDPMALVTRSYENRVPMLILGLVGVGLCIYGITEMRKLKRTGFWIYAIGEVLPIITMAIFVGLNLYSTLTLGSTFVFTILFLILYASQLKYLKK